MDFVQVVFLKEFPTSKMRFTDVLILDYLRCDVTDCFPHHTELLGLLSLLRKSDFTKK